MSTVLTEPGHTDNPAGEAILQARGVVKTFGAATVVHGVDLEVARGEFVSVMGPSGSGKSTLLYSISGMDAPSSGSVTLAGTELTGLKPRRLAELRLTEMGFVFQHVHLLRNLSLLDNVVLPARLAKTGNREEITRRGLELMERTGVAALADHDITQASGGQLQRIGICRALINRPSIIFADEPTGALDSAAATDIMQILGDLHAEGTTIVVVTHDPAVAARSQRLVYMRDGLIRAELGLGRFEPGADAEEELYARRVQVQNWLQSQHL
ncbi:ABC transporter ATP-binding protein [Enemella sp. A6]|uniref:ABC transporter ATP-binding protein n=1 Tax=Enemella sp. A6 TaxID=3440152 RepID=UPI003EBC4998